MLYPALPWDAEPGVQAPIYDPFGLREAVIPLYSRSRATGLLTGLGTSFRIDPYGNHLTAQHLLDDHFTEPEKTAALDAFNVGLLSIGIAFGAPPVPSELFVPIVQALGLRLKVDDPMGLLVGNRPKTAIGLDFLHFAFDTSRAPVKERPPLVVRVRGGSTRVGDRVMGVGFSELDSVVGQRPDNVQTLSEGMHGVIGEIIGLHPNGRGTLRAWPTIEVNVDWPGGMSGGPVFNEAGEVIGVISSGLDLLDDDDVRDYATATWFEPLGGTPYLPPTIDPNNPGWIRGWGVFSSLRDELVGLFPDKQQADNHLASLAGDHAVRLCSHHVGTPDYMLAEQQAVKWTHKIIRFLRRFL